MKRKIYPLFIVTIFLMSCEKYIDFKETISDPLLVLNATLTPDSMVSIQLTQSQFVLGEFKPFPTVRDADVTIFVNGEMKEKLIHRSDGIYMGEYSPVPKDEIKVKVIVDGYNRIFSQTVIPHKPIITVTDSTVSTRTVVANETVYRTLKLQLKLNDTFNEENYYYIKGVRNYYCEDKLLLSLPISLDLSSVLKNNVIDEDIFNEIIGNDLDKNRSANLFSDLLIDGENILFDFHLSDIIGSTTSVNGDELDDDMSIEYIIEIGEISVELYHYLISVNKALVNEDMPFFEPFRVYTNIENGIGIFGSYNSYRLKTRFKTKFLPYDF
ncbi:MAG: DUF4249 domain-containing protein [Proteiniphilum sp.]|nr:DUF4249 domain-containing protein [Proteiniphilum sp.]